MPRSAGFGTTGFGTTGFGTTGFGTTGFVAAGALGSDWRWGGDDAAFAALLSAPRTSSVVARISAALSPFAA
jgi:hypothetical protein